MASSGREGRLACAPRKVPVGVNLWPAAYAMAVRTEFVSLK